MIYNDLHKAWLQLHLDMRKEILSVIFEFFDCGSMSGRGLDRLVAVTWSLLVVQLGSTNCRVQSRELEGRSCHVSLFAREPSSLQRSTTLSPCTLFSPYSGPAWSTPSSHFHLMTTTPMMMMMMMIMLVFPISLILVPGTTKPSHHLAVLSSPLF